MNWILESLPKALVGIDRSGKVSYWNKSAETLFQRPKSEAVGQLLSELIIPERYRNAHARGLQAAASMGKIQPRTMDVPAVKADGSQFTAAIPRIRFDRAPEVL